MGVSWFEELPLLPGAIVVIGGFVLLSLLLARVVGVFVPKEMRREHNDLAGFIFAVVGVIYAVVLGFVAVGVWERFVAADDRTYDEASAITAVYRDAGSFDDYASLRADLRRYVHYAIAIGWPALESGTVQPDATSAEKLARDIRHAPVRDMRQQEVFGHMIERMSQALRDRDARLTEDSTGLNAVMWVVVIAGGFITIAFTYLFGFSRTFMQTLMIGTLAFLIGLVIFLTMSLDYPFRGAIRVGPEAFERTLLNFDQIDAVSVHTPATK